MPKTVNHTACGEDSCGRCEVGDDGRIYLTQGALDGRKVIRFQVGQFDTTQEDVLGACDVIRDVWEGLE